MARAVAGGVHGRVAPDRLTVLTYEADVEEPAHGCVLSLVESLAGLASHVLYVVPVLLCQGVMEDVVYAADRPVVLEDHDVCVLHAAAVAGAVYEDLARVEALYRRLAANYVELVHLLPDGQRVLEA